MKDSFISIFQNKRLRSLIFLIFWLIFIFIVIFRYAIPYNKILNEYQNNNSENQDMVEEEPMLFEDLKNSLLRYNFKYVYTVSEGENKVIYNGTMMGNETVGYKESELGIQKYYVRGTQIYEMVVGENVLVEDKTTNVYDGFLSVDKIMEKIEVLEYTQNNNEYNFQTDDFYVKMVVNDDNITKIEIEVSNIKYLLEFSNINEVTELNY